MKTNAIGSQYAQAAKTSSNPKADPRNPAEGIPLQSADSAFVAPQLSPGSPLRMYTEEEVSAMLQVSLSQLRKWRMKQNPRRVESPPFKKIGRMVR